jgi:hypothetical protein
MRFVIGLCLYLVSAAVLAAPWCLIKDAREICIYDSSEQCYNAVAREGGSCRENYLEVGAIGGARYCVVTSKFRRCQYRNRERCVRDALKVNGGCVDNIERALELSARNKAEPSSTSECEDIACELEISSAAAAAQNAAAQGAAEQVILDDDF